MANTTSCIIDSRAVRREDKLVEHKGGPGTRSLGPALDCTRRAGLRTVGAQISPAAECYCAQYYVASRSRFPERVIDGALPTTNRIAISLSAGMT
jgi:hypothetical protein